MPVVFDPASYEQMSDGALMRIAMERDELTPEALAALEAQLAKRGLKQQDVSKFADDYRTDLAAEERERTSKGARPWQFHAFGKDFYGKRDLKEMHNRVQYQATLFFTFFFIPLIPLGTYI